MDIDDKAKKCPHCQADQRIWFVRHPIITGIIAIILISMVASSGNSGNKSTNATGNNSTTSSETQASPSNQPAERQVVGTAKTIGAGTFTGGTDVAVGLYDVTPGAGQSGNFIMSGADSYNEILGSAGAAGGVLKVRVKVSGGDSIKISGLSKVTFTPVTTPFVKAYGPVKLYAGTFTVGEDIAAGRYMVTPGTGDSGNFIVSGADSYNEILGGDTKYGGVPSVSVSLTNGDEITISGLSTVNFAVAQ